MSAVILAVLIPACGDNSEPVASQRTEPEDVASFYRDHPITILHGSSVGGGYDNTARLLARHMGRHIPGNPAILVQSMPGAGSLIAANHMYNVAPKDGTMMGTFVETAILAPLFKVEGARYDPRTVNWLGSLSSRAGSSVVVVRSDAPVTTLKEARQTPISIGTAGGMVSTTTIYPRLLNDLIGTKFNIVPGYPGGVEVMLALERGELQGYAGLNWYALQKEKPDWIARRFIRPIAQLTLKSDPLMPDIPLALDYVSNDEDRRVMELAFSVLHYSRVFSTAPGVPPERVAALREAFRLTMADPGFIADANRTMSDALQPATHDALQEFVTDAYRSPPEIVDRVARYFKP
jgi:tripartite-type tricarboxylate transporter receptor subunit TctC